MSETARSGKATSCQVLYFCISKKKDFFPQSKYSSGFAQVASFNIQLSSRDTGEKEFETRFQDLSRSVPESLMSSISNSV